MTTDKLLFLDMEGVIFDVGYFENMKRVSSSVWRIIHEEVGSTEEEGRMKRKWIAGEYERFSDWGYACVDVLKKYELNKEFFLNIVNNLPLMKGAKEAFSKIKDKGYITAVLTGGFESMGSRAQKELEIDYIVAAHSLNFDGGGKLVSANVLDVGYEGKIEYANKICSKLGLKLKDCKLVADGVNDIPLAREVGFSIAFNAREELKKECDVSINEKDLRLILDYL